VGRDPWGGCRANRGSAVGPTPVGRPAVGLGWDRLPSGSHADPHVQRICNGPPAADRSPDASDQLQYTPPLSSNLFVFPQPGPGLLSGQNLASKEEDMRIGICHPNEMERPKETEWNEGYKLVSLATVEAHLRTLFSVTQNFSDRTAFEWIFCARATVLPNGSLTQRNIRGRHHHGNDIAKAVLQPSIITMGDSRG